MNISTLSQHLYPQREKSHRNYRKAGLYIANFMFAVLLIRYGSLFSDAITVPCSIFVISVFLYGAFTQLRRLADGSSIKAYIKSHEALALILLAIFLIAGTVFYVDFQPHHGSGSVGTAGAAHS